MSLWTPSTTLHKNDYRDVMLGTNQHLSIWMCFLVRVTRPVCEGKGQLTGPTMTAKTHRVCVVGPRDRPRRGRDQDT